MSATTAALPIGKGGPGLLNVSGQAGPGLAAAKSYRGAVFADFNNDGQIDIALSALDDAPSLLMNQGTPEQQWILIQLEGTKSNRSGVGARITVNSGGMTQTREVKAGGSYASSNDPRAHFGLGAAKTIDEIAVTWPSGKSTMLTGVKPGQILKIRE